MTEAEFDFSGLETRSGNRIEIDTYHNRAYSYPSKSGYTSESQTGMGGLKQCVRQGDKISYCDESNIHMVNSFRPVQSSRMRSLEDNQVDKVLSGESLYKTFSFKESSNNEEIEKCIEFWKNVMEKNLEPVKCTIIEDLKKPVIKEVEKLSVGDNNSANVVEEKSLADSFKNMWITAVKELQRKNLHKVKLKERGTCKMCDSVSSIIKDDMCQAGKKLFQKEIIDLNKWKPSSKKATGPVLGRKISKQSTSSSSQSSENKLSEVASYPEAPTLKSYWKPEPDTNTYKHIDVIKEKKNSGVYSQWRSNKVKSKCPCDNPECKCNTDPAILALKSPSDTGGHKETTEQQSVDGNCWQTLLSDTVPEAEKCIESTTTEPVFERPEEYEIGEVSAAGVKSTEDFKLPDDYEEIEAHRNTFCLMIPSALRVGKETNTEFFPISHHQSLKKTLSVIVRCSCGNKECDCGWIAEELTHQGSPDFDIDIPPPPPRKSGAHKIKLVSSLDILRKKYSSRFYDSNEAPDLSQDYNDYDTDDYDNDEINGYDSDENNDDDDDDEDDNEDDNEDDKEDDKDDDNDDDNDDIIFKQQKRETIDAKASGEVIDISALYSTNIPEDTSYLSFEFNGEGQAIPHKSVDMKHRHSILKKSSLEEIHKRFKEGPVSSRNWAHDRRSDQRRSEPLQKVMSFMLPTCKCSHEECDCPNLLALVNRSVKDIEDNNKPLPLPKRGLTTLPKDSVEILRTSRISMLNTNVEQRNSKK